MEQYYYMNKNSEQSPQTIDDMNPSEGIGGRMLDRFDKHPSLTVLGYMLAGYATSATERYGDVDTLFIIPSVAVASLIGGISVGYIAEKINNRKQLATPSPEPPTA